MSENNASTKGDFTPGANLNPRQIGMVMSFLATKGANNTETINNMQKWFADAEKVQNR